MLEVTRQSIDDALSRQKWNEVYSGLRRLFALSPDLATAQFVLDRLAQTPHPLNPVSCRVYILRSFTLEPLVPLLRAAALVQGIDLTIQLGDFNAYAQEILDPQSGLYRFDPQVVFLALQTRDLVPDIWERFTGLSASAILTESKRAEGNLIDWVATFRSRHQASLVIHTLELPPVPQSGVLDLQRPEGQLDAIQALNQALRRVAAGHSGVYLLDYDGLVARYGRGRWHDERRWLTTRMPIVAGALMELVNEYLRFLLPLTGRIAKALVVDLDNTLWGGVVGEDGPAGIKLGPEYPGAAYLALQQAILDLHRRGIILAVCSKNNPADALEVLEKHSAMLLGRQHFAALHINWNDKVENLREIATELNIGTEALAFLDDNPAERERVRLEMPEVCVIDLPPDPMLFASALRACPAFERLSLSEEDRDRGQYYSAERQRRELTQSANSLEDFYRSLAMEAEIAAIGPASLPRAAQLTQKTNQFNLTTRRYTEQQIAEFCRDPSSHVYALQARDRFGDNGQVGLAITRWRGEAVEIDTFLLSCRVIGRTLETALLAHLMNVAAKEGATVLRGEFIATQKNAPARNVYLSHGFRKVEESGGVSTWEYPLQGERLACPEWIRLKIREGDP
jgi:FkbH-like protein